MRVKFGALYIAFWSLEFDHSETSFHGIVEIDSSDSTQDNREHIYTRIRAGLEERMGAPYAAANRVVIVLQMTRLCIRRKANAKPGGA